MKVDRDTFGPHLKLQREQRGISLKQIAESTKIKEHLFAELERGDFSKWPQGIFRRAHLCAYVSAIGLPSQPVLADFLRLFPEAPPVEEPETVHAPAVPGVEPVRQTVNPTPSRSSQVSRAWVVGFDLALVCLMSSVLAAVAGMNLWPAVALVGLGYSAIGSACFAQSIGAYVQHRMKAHSQVPSQPKVSATAPIPEVRVIAPMPPRKVFSQEEMTEEPEVERRRASA